MQKISQSLLSYFALSMICASQLYGGVSLIERSPFKKNDKVPEKVEVLESDPELKEILDFIGTYEFQGERRFSLQLLAEDSRKRWFELGESVLGYTLEQYQVENRTLLIRKDSNLFALTLSEDYRNRREKGKRTQIKRPPLKSKRPPSKIPRKVEFPNVLRKKA